MKRIVSDSAVTNVLELTFGDRRVGPAPRASFFGWAQNKSLAGASIHQIGKDVYDIGDQAFFLRAGSMGHLVTPQVFWGAAKARRISAFIMAARSRGKVPIVLICTAIVPRRSREEQAQGVSDPMPDAAIAFGVPAVTVAEFLKGKKVTGAGLVHIWVLRDEDDRYHLTNDAYQTAGGIEITQMAEQVQISPEVQEFIAGGGGIWVSELTAGRAAQTHQGPPPTGTGLPGGPAGMDCGGHVYDLDLVVQGLKVTGRVIIKPL